MDWISFYDFKHSVIYVNERHRDVHYRTIAEDIARLRAARIRRNVLDYGCGEATSADLVADGRVASDAGRGRAQCARRADRALRRQCENFRADAGRGRGAARRLVRSHRACIRWRNI